MSRAPTTQTNHGQGVEHGHGVEHGQRVLGQARSRIGAPLTTDMPAPKPVSAQRVTLRAQSFVDAHRLLLIALIMVVLFHGTLLLSGSYQRTYDAYVHIFFASHYTNDWFSSWDERWYTGFSVLSYPPGSHQLIAAVSSVFGLQGGYVIVQLSALLLLTVGVYRWSALWVGNRAAGWAAMLVVVSTSVAETVHVFGQLPTTVSLGLLLNALPFADKWIRRGSVRALVVGIACIAATTATHHVTTLFGALFFVGPVMLAAIAASVRIPLPDEPPGHVATFDRTLLWPLIARRARRALPTTRRAVIFGLLLIATLLIVVLPYWLYSRSDPISQISIPHGSRESYLEDPNAGLIFWLIPWGILLLVLPYALLRGFDRRRWPLGVSLVLLTILGTGGTTPIPRLILGASYDILTLDRFTFWATIAILPLAGAFVVSMRTGTVRVWLMQQFGKPLSIAVPSFLLIASLALAMFASNLTHYRPFQPAAIDIRPITDFLDKDQHAQWRYLTLGFGDQMAWLSANTTAKTVDGNYHSARKLPELTSRPVERLEGAKYAGVPGIGSLQQFLATPGRYNLKFVFSNDDFYSPLLSSSGWTSLGPLQNGVELWERADVAPMPLTEVTGEAPAWQRYWWGIIPPAAISSALIALVWSAWGYPGLGRVPELRHRLRARRTHRKSPFDLALLRASRKVPADAAELSVRDSWLPWPGAKKKLRRTARSNTSRARRQFQSVVLVTMFLVSIAASYVALSPQDATPGAVVMRYYEHLDFRRFDQAYELLSPNTRPTFAAYRRELGRDGGLVASYSKLDSIAVHTVSSVGDTVTVDADVRYLTALQSYEVVTRLDVTKADGEWRITLPAADASVPQDQFISLPTVDFHSQGRRSVAETDSTSTVDVLDRPELQITNVRSLKVGSRWVVIGRVTNSDVDPADITITAQLRDKAGELLASWDAAQVTFHKLLPGAQTPFRIEFQSIAGTADYGTEADGGLPYAVTDSNRGLSIIPATPRSTAQASGPVEFDPQVITPLVLAPDAVVDTVSVYARAVITPHVQGPELQLFALTIETTESGKSYVSGSIRNSGTTEASVPHVLLSYVDAAGVLAWVDHAYLPTSIAAQATAGFRIQLAKGMRLSDSGLPVSSYSGPVAEELTFNEPQTIPMPETSGFSGVSLTASSYSRGG